jgi:hypothetical protein
MLYPAELRARYNILPRSGFGGMTENSKPEQMSGQLWINAQLPFNRAGQHVLESVPQWKEREIF